MENNLIISVCGKQRVIRVRNEKEMQNYKESTRLIGDIISKAEDTDDGFYVEFREDIGIEEVNSRFNDVIESLLVGETPINEDLLELPKFVVSDIERAKKMGMSLLELGYDLNIARSNFEKTSNWIYWDESDDEEYSKKEDNVVYAWLHPDKVKSIDLPEPDIEKLYKVEIPTANAEKILCIHNSDDKQHFFTDEYINDELYKTYLTEEEVKKCDRRFWGFAERVHV